MVENVPKGKMSWEVNFLILLCAQICTLRIRLLVGLKVFKLKLVSRQGNLYCSIDYRVIFKIVLKVHQRKVEKSDETTSVRIKRFLEAKLVNCLAA